MSATTERIDTAQLPVVVTIKRHRIRRFILWWLKLALILVVLSELVTVAFIWVTPPRTAYMLEGGEPVAYQYVSTDHISRLVLAATIAHEDEQLGTRFGPFSGQDFTKRALDYLQGKPDPSGSTIPQQLVKNIFLWPGQNGLRKAIEAGLATEFSFTLTPKRILELYLNYAQFGPKLYGICAATWYYFSEPPWYMDATQAGQLMGVLPLPDRVHRQPGGGIHLDKQEDSLVWEYVNGAANVWVPQQIAAMGGWQATVATVGIHDTAGDHYATQGQSGCGSMPDSVTALLKADGEK